MKRILTIFSKKTKRKNLQKITLNLIEKVILVTKTS